MGPVDARAFREAMSRLGSAVHVITVGPAGARQGLTASAVCSVTDSPPTLLFCLNRSVSSRDAFTVGVPACVNTLLDSQKEIATVFADKERVHERFDWGNWTTLSTGAPVLEGAAATFDCVISQIVEVGTHSVVFAEVQALRKGPSAPVLLYLDRAYHRIPMEGAEN